MGKVRPFEGAGIYALYYNGDFPAYSPISGKETPIYVGKAIPKGARKGRAGPGAAPGNVLYQRLKEHTRSIAQVSNLRLEHFLCRYLVVEDIWIPLGEKLLIERFAPLWNTVVDGFGIHEPGKGRHQQQCSLWDVIHPGRPLAAKLPPNVCSTEEILGSICAALSGNQPE